MPHAMPTSATKKRNPVSTVVCMSMVTRNEAVNISAEGIFGAHTSSEIRIWQ